MSEHQPPPQSVPPPAEPDEVPEWQADTVLLTLTDWTTSPTVVIEVVRNTASSLAAVTSGSGVHRLNKRIFGALFSLAAAALAARFVGVINQAIISATFGLSPAMDAFFTAQSLPTLITGLIVGSLDVTIVPIYVVAFKNRNDREKSVLFSTIMNALVLFTLVLVAIMLAADRFLLHIVAPSIGAGAATTAAQLAPIVFPILGLNVITGYLNGILNAREQFGLPAFAAVLVPIAMTVGTIWGTRAGIGVTGLAIGLTVGAVLQMVVVLVRAFQARLRYRPVLDWHVPELRQVVTLGAPILVGNVLIMANPVVDQIVASTLGPGVISGINYALKIVDIFVVLMFASAARAIFPYFSHQAAAKNIVGIKNTLRLYAWLIGATTTFLALLAFILAPAIVHILFGHGNFTAQDAALTVTIFRGFLPGLPAMALGFIVPRVFSAIRRNDILMWLSPISLAVNAILDVILARSLGPVGISLSTSFVLITSLTIQINILTRLIGPLDLLAPPDITVVQSLPVIGKLARIVSLIARGLQTGAILRKPIVQATMAVVVLCGEGLAAAIDADRTLRVTLGVAALLIFIRYPMILLFTWGLLAPFEFASFAGHNLIGELNVVTLPALGILLILNFREIMRRHPSAAVMLGFAIWMILGIFHSPLSHYAFFQASQVYGVFLGMMALVSLIDSRDRLYQVIDSMLLLAIPIAAYGIAQTVFHFGGFYDAGTYRAQSIFDWSDTFGFYLGLTIPLTIFRAYCTPTRWRLFWTIALIPQIGGLVATYSRTSEVAVAGGVIVLLWLLGKRGRIAAIALAGAIAAALPIVGRHLLSRFTTDGITTLSGRLYFWKELLAHFDWLNLTGNGLGAGEAFIARLTGGAFGSPHSTFLQVLYDTGVPGLALFLLALLLPAIHLLRARPSAQDVERRGARALAVGVLAVGFAFALTSPLLVSTLCIPFWIIASLPFSRAFTPAPQPAPEPALSLDKLSAQRVPALVMPSPLTTAEE
jgi:putative peptidoglycan lipid II flippase